tara:strand:- start:3291 stop:3668 length:378 start_codon:yes stop_codon:yes gene_type:complete
MKVMLELEEVAGLISLLRRHLLPDTPSNKENDRILKEEATLLLNLLLTQQMGVVDLDDDYLNEFEWVNEIEMMLEDFWTKREWGILFPMNLRPCEFRVANSQGLTIIRFEGDPCVKNRSRLPSLR